MKNLLTRLTPIIALLIFSFPITLQSQLPVPVAFVDAESMELNMILDRFEQPSLNGAISFSVSEIAIPTEMGYVNVVVDLNPNLLIEPFPAPDGNLQEEWIVQNVPLPMTEEIFTEPMIDIWFPLLPLDVAPGQVFNCAILISDTPVDLPQPFPFEIIPPELTPVQLSMDIFFWGINDYDGQEGDVVGVIDPVILFPITIPIYEIEGPNAPDGMPDIGQQTNECGPTSAANSLIWLAKKHGFAEQLPQDNDGEIDVDQLILDLMEAMAGNNARPFGGLSGDQLKEGKEKFIEENDLPLVVKGGKDDANANGASAVNFIISELNDGEDVEMLVDWPGPGSHWVTVTGYGIGIAGPVIYVHDPDDGRTAKTVWTLELNQDLELTGRFISPAECPIMWAVSESFEPNSTEKRSSMVDELSLYPNPFENVATIRYALRNAAEIRLTIRDARGALLRVVEEGYRTGGLHEVRFEAGDLPSGIYFCTLGVGDEEVSIRMLIE